jgi:hypothetical protein
MDANDRADFDRIDAGIQIAFAEAAIAGPSQAPAERWWRRWRPGSRG